MTLRPNKNSPAAPFFLVRTQTSRHGLGGDGADFAKVGVLAFLHEFDCVHLGGWCHSRFSTQSRQFSLTHATDTDFQRVAIRNGNAHCEPAIGRSAIAPN